MAVNTILYYYEAHSFNIIIQQQPLTKKHRYYTDNQISSSQIYPFSYQ